MISIFHRIISKGIFSDTPIGLRDEVRVINSIKVQGAAMVWVAGLLVAYFMPAHWIFLFSVMCIHLCAALLVVYLNSIKLYRTARTIFIVDPAILILALSAYFGLEVNFQYIALVCFLAFVFLFKSRTAYNVRTLAAFMLITLLGTLFLFLFDLRFTELTLDEVRNLRVAAFSLSSGLCIMMGAVLYQSAAKTNARTQETLKVSAQDASILQTISDNMEEAIFKSSVEHGFVYVNEAFARIFGYETKQRMMATHPVNLYNSKVERDSLLARISRQGKVSNVLMNYRRIDGTNFWGRLSCTLIREENNDYIVGTITDITLQQEQNEQLQESEQQLRNAQQLAKLVNWRIYPQEVRVEWSAECAHIHGFLAMDYQDSFSVWIDGLQDIDLEKIEQGIMRASQMNDSFEFGSWYCVPSGAKKYLYYICGLEKNGEYVHWYGTVQDRTELKNQELELISTRQFYQNILDNIPVEAILIDENLNYHYISKNAIQDDEFREWMKGKSNQSYSEFRGPMANSPK